MSDNSFGAKDTLDVGGREYEIFRLDALQQRFDVARLPFSLKVLLENLLRTEGNGSVTAADIEALASWDAAAQPSIEIAFTPARVLMQDFTGVPAVVDLAAMRDAIAEMGGDAAQINPLVPAELVIDHSVQVDAFGTRDAFRVNAEREFERNQERYAFLRWGQGAFDDFAVVPPDTGIVHQVNLEYLARVVFPRERSGSQPPQAYPDTLVGTDSHTTMINGLGVLGWGVGGIEAEAAMLGQPMSMLIPQVLGFRLHGRAARGRDRDRSGADRHRDAARARGRGQVRRVLRRRPRGAADRRPRDDRQHVARVRLDVCDLSDRRRDARLPAPLRTARRADRARRGLCPRAGPVARRALGAAHVLGRDRARPGRGAAEPRRTQAPAGSRRALATPATAFREALSGYVQDYDWRDEASAESFPSSDPPANGSDRPKADDGGPSYARQSTTAAATAAAGLRGGAAAPQQGTPMPVTLADGTPIELAHGHVVIAAITSCTNTSNPSVMIGAGILARNASPGG